MPPCSYWLGSNHAHPHGTISLLPTLQYQYNTNLADTRLCLPTQDPHLLSACPRLGVCTTCLSSHSMVLFCRKPQLLRSTAASFHCFVLGYLLLIVASNISLLLMSTAIRSAGSAVLWIYSTLMLQYLVPNQLLGRIMALEMALFTVRLVHALLTTRRLQRLIWSSSTSFIAHECTLSYPAFQ